MRREREVKELERRLHKWLLLGQGSAEIDGMMRAILWVLEPSDIQWREVSELYTPKLPNEESGICNCCGGALQVLTDKDATSIRDDDKLRCTSCKRLGHASCLDGYLVFCLYDPDDREYYPVPEDEM